MLRSLRMKLILILVVLIATVMAVIGVYLINDVGTYYREDFYSEMGDVFTSDFLDTFRELAAGEDSAARAEEFVLAHSLQLGLDSSRDFYLLDGVTGACLGGSDSSRTVEKTSNVLTALAGSVGMEGSNGDSYFDLAVPVTAGETSYIIYIRDDKTDVSDLQQMLLSAILQALLFGLVTAVLLSIFLSYTISRPIESLTKSAQQLAKGDFTNRPPVYSDDEIGVLTKTFNDMSRTLEDTLDAVANERNKLSAVFQHMTDGIVALDRAGSVLHINDAARVILGIAEGEQPSTCAEALERLGVESGEILALENGQTVERTCRYGGRDLRLFCTTFGSEEHEGGVIAVLYDITEQERLNTSRREFVADVSHELRTPLTNIRSYAETILSDDQMPDEYRVRFMQVILNETDRMTRLVKDLLTISKLDYGRTDWNITVLEPETLIRNTVDAMEMEARRRGLALTLHVTGALPRVAADGDRLSQVYANVISNALKYTPEGGSVTVTAFAENGGAAVAVRDTGIGIPEGDLPKIFDRFYRVDKARSREKGGSGLGLAIAKEFIDYLHGDIRIDSVVQQGTTVTVWLPGAPEDAAV